MGKREDRIKAKADYGLDVLDAEADAWAVEADIMSMVKNIVSPMRLNKNAPDEVRESFTHRMEVHIDAIIRQAFVEGAYRAITRLQDEHKRMRELGITKRDLTKAANTIVRRTGG